MATMQHPPSRCHEVRLPTLPGEVAAGLLISTWSRWANLLRIDPLVTAMWPKSSWVGASVL
jgi:hypothetical protein